MMKRLMMIRIINQKGHFLREKHKLLSRVNFHKQKNITIMQMRLLENVVLVIM